MDWLHCNRCIALPQNGIQYFLTSCGHIFCQNCLQTNQTNCAVCGNKFQAKAVTADLVKNDPNLSRFFSDPLDINKNVTEVLKFQRDHRSRLVTCFRKKLEGTVEESKKMKSEYQKLHEEYQKLRQILENMTKERQSLHQKIEFLMKENNSLKQQLAAARATLERPGSVSSSGSSSRPDGMNLSRSGSQYFQVNQNPPEAYRRPYDRGSGELSISPQQMARQVSQEQFNSQMSANQRMLVRSPPDKGKYGQVAGAVSVSPELAAKLVSPPTNYMGFPAAQRSGISPDMAPNPGMHDLRPGVMPYDRSAYQSSNSSSTSSFYFPSAPNGRP